MYEVITFYVIQNALPVVALVLTNVYNVYPTQDKTHLEIVLAMKIGVKMTVRNTWGHAI